MDRFSKLNLGVDGDSITAGDQWSYHVYKELGLKTHHNVAVGSAVWYKRTVEMNGTTISTQDYGSPDFAGISGGWEQTDDIEEMQRRLNNCAVVHIQRFIAEVDSGDYPVPDIFVFAMGTNDDKDSFGDPEKALSGKNLDDDSEVDVYTEAGAMRWCIQKIQENYPECCVFVMTPLQTANPEHNEKTQLQLSVMRIMCQGMSVQMIDCYSGCGICEKYENIGCEGRYLRDGLHPKDNGQRLEGRFAAKEIRNNYF